MMARALLAPAFLAIGSLALGSCSGLPHGEDGVAAVQFQDMVVPAGLLLIENAHQSHSLEAASWREGRFVYSGLVSPAEAAGYVRQRMPLHNWKLVSDEAPDDQSARLRYERGYYATEYHFTRVNGRTQLVVDYGTDYTRR